MDDFKPLSPILQGYYDLDFEQLPQEIQEDVSEAFFPIPWNRLSAEQRQRYVESWDYRNNPATEPERQRIAKLLDEEEEIHRRLDKWKVVGTPTATDLALQEKTLADLRKRQGDLDVELSIARGDVVDLTHGMKSLDPVQEVLHQRERDSLLNIIRALAELQGVKPMPTRKDGDGWRKTAADLTAKFARKGIESPVGEKTLAEHLRKAFSGKDF